SSSSSRRTQSSGVSGSEVTGRGLRLIVSRRGMRRMVRRAHVTNCVRKSRMRVALVLLLWTCTAPPAHHAAPAPAGETPRGGAAMTDFDLLIRGGDVIDGSGVPRVHADVGIRGDTIVAVGDLSHKSAAA